MHKRMYKNGNRSTWNWAYLRLNWNCRFLGKYIGRNVVLGRCIVNLDNLADQLAENLSSGNCSLEILKIGILYDKLIYFSQESITQPSPNGSHWCLPASLVKRTVLKGLTCQWRESSHFLGQPQRHLPADQEVIPQPAGENQFEGPTARSRCQTRQRTKKGVIEILHDIWNMFFLPWQGT